MSLLTQLFETGWAKALAPHVSPQQFKILGQKIAQLRKTTTVYPSKDRVFRAFELTPFRGVKCVMVGQDPYHDGSADGLAFSASLNLKKLPPSLRLILAEVDDNYPERKSDISEGKLDPWDLSRWAEQGVFLTNMSYTVQGGKAGSHTAHWKEFFKSVVQALQTKNDIVWLLLGREARNFAPLITNQSHSIIEEAHPAADLYSGSPKFRGCGCFRRVNEELDLRNLGEILW